MQITLMCGNGSHSRNQTSAAAKTTKTIRTSSVHSTWCSCCSRSAPRAGLFTSGAFRASAIWEVFAEDFSIKGEELMKIFPSVPRRGLFQVRLDHVDHFIGGHYLL